MTRKFKTGPIKPEEVQSVKNKLIPPEVFEVVNKLIVKDWNGKFATVIEKDIVKLLVAMLGCGLPEIYDNGWLDFEDVYRDAGWNVKYDKPAYNETYEASYKFTK